MSNSQNRAMSTSSPSSSSNPSSISHRSSRRIAGQKPELEVIKRSRRENVPILDVQQDHINDHHHNSSISNQMDIVEDTREDSPKTPIDNLSKTDSSLLQLSPASPSNSLHHLRHDNHHNYPLNLSQQESMFNHDISSDSSKLDSNNRSSQSSVLPYSSEHRPPSLDTSSLIILDSSVQLIDDDSEAYWAQRMAQLGISKILLIPPSSPPEHIIDDDSSDSDMDIDHKPDFISLEDPTNKNDSKKKKKLKKKKKANNPKRQLPAEEFEETEEEIHARLIRVKNYELQALEELQSSLNLITSNLTDPEIGPRMLAVSKIFSELLEDCALEVVQSVHQSIIRGNAVEEVHTGNNYDVFGQEIGPKIDSFLCDEGCGRMIASNRYAPHLEKCLGLHAMKSKGSRRSGADH